MNTIHFKAKKYLVDGVEDKYRCARIYHMKGKSYLWLIHSTNVIDQFWYDPQTQSKTDIPFKNSMKSNDK